MKQILPIQSIGVLAESELSSSARLVAVMLMYHVNRKTGFCFPSVATLAADCGCQPATVKKALSELRECGFITWETKQIPKSSTRANHYNLSFAHWSNIDQCNDQSNSLCDSQCNDQSNDWSNDQLNDQSNDWSNDQLNDQSNDRSKNGYKPYKPKEDNNTPLTPQGGKRAAAEEYSDEFELFWSEYPNHNSGKKKAYAAFKRALKKVSFAELMKSLEAHKKSRQWTKDGGAYIPHATTWLNGERWTVEMDDVLDDGRYVDEEGYVWSGRKYVCNN